MAVLPIGAAPRHPLRPMARRSVLGMVSARDGLEGLQRSSAFMTAPSPLVAVDRDLNVRGWNAMAAATDRIPADAVLGKPAWDSFPILEVNGALSRMEDALRGRVSVRMEWYAIPKTARYFIQQTHRRPLYGRDGTIIGVLSWWQVVLPVEPFPWPDEEERFG